MILYVRNAPGEGIDEKFMRTCKICNKKKMVEEFSQSNDKIYKNPCTICDDCFFDVDYQTRNKILGTANKN